VAQELLLLTLRPTSLLAQKITNWYSTNKSPWVLVGQMCGFVFGGADWQMQRTTKCQLMADSLKMPLNSYVVMMQ
jgi:hypothetical protein